MRSRSVDDVNLKMVVGQKTTFLPTAPILPGGLCRSRTLAVLQALSAHLSLWRIDCPHILAQLRAVVVTEYKLEFPERLHVLSIGCINALHVKFILFTVLAC